MKRRTQAPPAEFTVDNAEYKSQALPFMDANEMIFEYLPVVAELIKVIRLDEDDSEDLDIGPLLQHIPKSMFRELLTKLLCQTSYRLSSKDPWELVDPNDFDSIKEAFNVCKKVAGQNWPDFFKGEGIELPTPTPAKQESPEPKQIVHEL